MLDDFSSPEKMSLMLFIRKALLDKKQLFKWPDNFFEFKMILNLNRWSLFWLGWIAALSPVPSDCWSTSAPAWLPLPVLISWMLQYVPDVTFTPATFVFFFYFPHRGVSVEFNLNPISECEGADPHLSWRLSVHVWHPQAFIIYIAAPPKHKAPLEVWMKNLPPNLEATHIYSAWLSESGARSVRIIIAFLETSSSSAQAAALQRRWLCLLNQRLANTGAFTGPFFGKQL